MEADRPQEDLRVRPGDLLLWNPGKDVAVIYLVLKTRTLTSPRCSDRHEFFALKLSEKNITCAWYSMFGEVLLHRGDP